MSPSNRRNALHGAPLHPNAAIAQEYAAAIMTLVRRLHDGIKREMARVFDERQFHAQALDDDKGADVDGGTGISGQPSGTVASQARITLNGLLDRYTPLFNRLARKATKRMIERTLKNSAVTLGLSLRDISKDLTIKPVMTERLQEIVTASTAEAAGLIKLIPQQYLGDVQGAVMRSITGGGGLKELVPFLNTKYGQNIRHARNVAMDQTRKSYSNITAGRMQAIGVKKYVWMHIGGAMHPREKHIALNGKTCSLDNPPEIGEMYGQKVYGKPGDLPHCRCVMRPVVSFGEDQ
ncbi:MAG: phage head morphogenesis protein [Burkholderiaceae bacterium]|nr:phage head morphogenesis protein [Burkholderiaceae bacterium]